MRQEWEAAHTVTEELVQGPPSRRANATLTACPNGNHLWCIGGEYFSEDGKAVRIASIVPATPTDPPLSTFTMTFFATLPTRYVSEPLYIPSDAILSPKDEWRKFVSQTCPGPRSAHSVVASPAGGGKLYLFGAVLVISKPLHAVDDDRSP